jgi:hypothetical protein
MVYYLCVAQAKDIMLMIDHIVNKSKIIKVLHYYLKINIKKYTYIIKLRFYELQET